MQKNPKNWLHSDACMGVGQGTPETPTLTTFNGVKAWQFSVNNDSYNIYINAITGQRIPNNMITILFKRKLCDIYHQHLLYCESIYLYPLHK